METSTVAAHLAFQAERIARETGDLPEMVVELFRDAGIVTEVEAGCALNWLDYLRFSA